MSKILDSLYLGSYADAKNQNLLISLGITHIVTVGVELRPIFPTSFKYFYIPAFDSPEYKLNVYFDEAADFIHKAIEKANGKVLVHCHWGISRSTTIVLAYLIKYHKMTPFEAKVFVKKRRSIIGPNGGFIQQIDAYARKLNILKTEKEQKVIPKEAIQTFYNSTSPKRIWPATDGKKERTLESKSSMRSTSNIFQKSAKKTNELKGQSIFGYNTSIGFTKDLLHGNQGLKLNPRKPKVTFAESPQINKSYNQDIKDIFEKKKELRSIFKPKEEIKEDENKNKVHDYYCKECKLKLFDSFDVIHKPGKESHGKCNAIYIRFMQWMGFMKGNVSKLFCPNSRCNVIIGYINQNGGKCSCGKPIERMFVIYPVRITNNKNIKTSDFDF